MDSEGYRLSFESLAELAQRARADGAEFRLVLFPGLQRLDSDYYQNLVYSKVEAFGAARGIQVVNLFPDFRGRDPFELHVSIVDAHPNAKGHAIAADALFSALFPTIESSLRGR